jgi:signal transduction histidine kinase/ActR/RegA family two-component response regulator
MSDAVQEDRPLYSSRITNNYIKLIRHKYSHINVNELLRSAEIEPFQIEDEGHWFTQKQINFFHEKLQVFTGNKDIARETGLYSASPEALGGIRQYVLGLASIATAYKLAGDMSNKFTRSSVYTSRRTAPEQVEVVATPNEGVQEEPFQCESRKGYLESIAKAFNYKLPRIDHPECIFKGGKSCRYIVSWKKSRAALLKKTRNIALPVLAGAVLLLSFIPGMNLSVVLTGSIAFIAILSWYAEFLDVRELRAAVDSLSDSSNKLVEQTNMNYNNTLMINEIGVALNKESAIDGVLVQISRILQKRLDFDRGLVMLANQAKTSLEYRAGYGYTDDQLATIKEIAFQLGDIRAHGIFTDSFQNRKAVLLNNLDEIKDDFTVSSFEFVQKLGVTSIICCPIIYENEALGILAVENTKSKRPLLQRDINLLMGVSSQIGSRIHNVLLEEQFRQTQKMEAVGILAGGVAHDFNNILTTIIGYSEIISTQMGDDDPLKEKVKDIFQAGEKAAALTRQLLAFSRKQVMELKVTNLNTIVKNIGKMLGRMIGEDIELELLTGKQIGNIKADIGQVEQILLNLAINARDAMPCGGLLSIETGEVLLDEQYARTHSGLKPGMYAILAVADTGEGMAREVQENIFEPFFTTKELGKGTGLGLATVYGIVKQLKGHIYVYSEPEKGSTFKLYFPVITDPVVEKTLQKDTGLAYGTEKILVVDDDASIRRLVFDALEPLGYTLLEASCGNDALELCRKSKEKVDLILSDVIMPGMNGRELIETLKKENPEIKSVLMSGYTDNIVARQGVLKPGITFINKPLRPISLANKIRSVLDNTGKVKI